MENSDLSKAKKNLFAKAFDFRNNARNVISPIYDVGGKMFRDSLLGKLTKGAITSDFTKTQRDKVLDKFGAPEHYKRFAQYLTGGTVGNQDITSLPVDVQKDILTAHSKGMYPDKEEFITAGKFKGKPNPSYNPDSNLLSTYMEPKRTAYSLGHVQFKPNQGGGYTMTDTYKVDSNEAMGAKPYIPLVTRKSDLGEGGIIASRLYDLSKFLGINNPMKYNVKLDVEN
tara:strand:+ start:241 stop:921 length:681 start_codon:yes stop_codon:yes gene_type:complete